MRRKILLTVLVFLSMGGWVTLSAPNAAAARPNYQSPDNGWHRIRGSNMGGVTRKIPFEAYFPDSYKGVKTIRLVDAGTGISQFGEPCDRDGASLRVGGVGSYTNFCGRTLTITLTNKRTSDVPGYTRWNAEVAALNLGSDTTYKFWASLNRTDAFLTMSSHAVTSGGDGHSVWGAYDYAIRFGPPPSACSSSVVRERVGVWDPDDSGSWRVNITLQRLDGSSWTNVTNGGYSPQRGTIRSGVFYADQVDEQSANFMYNFTTGKKYRILVHAYGKSGGGSDARKNTLVLQWPFPTIHGFIAPSCNYSLTPAFSNIPKARNPGVPITGTGTITNNGGATSPSNAWQITRITYDPDSPRRLADLDDRYPPGSNPTNGRSTLDPNQLYINAYLKDPSTSTKDILGSGTQAFGNLSRNINNPGPSDVGTIVCYYISVQRPQTGDAANIWRHSQLQCTQVTKNPVLKIIGGDLRVLDSPAASGTINVNNGTGTLGSWVEYGVFSTGPNSANEIGSAGAYGRASLTFTNNGTPHGNFTGLTSSASNLIGAVDRASSSGFSNESCGTISLSPDSGLKRKYTCNSTVTVNGATNIKGQHVIDARGQTVNITGDIQYDSNCGSVDKCTAGNLPQVIIIAKNIIIQPNVANVDAWLITTSGDGSDYINTCGAIASFTNPRISTANCGTALTINGPVVTSNLHAYRAGSPTDVNAPVETFKLRPDAYLWLYLRNTNALKLRTNAIHELPPRY